MAKKIGVILSGCGVKDGAEIHEAVCAMLALDRAGAEIVCLAPNKDQADVVNHVTGAPQGEKRNVLVEAARIARGQIRDVATVKASDLDRAIVPGGFGAAKNLCTFASDGPDCKVDPGVQKLLRDLHAAKKPIGALCIAPALVAAIFGKDVKPELTIGTDEGTAKALEKMGAKHVKTPVTDIVVDRKNKIATTACYMLATRISEVAAGAEKVVKAVLEMA
ncbi:MAG: isoprenoid biosynthesis glyoxalase ElbB [Planctomycetes bacterium]|nr:isoprenoid biosynthesis glyoxalase ElbB [Planctomycetota bacterium]